MTATEIQQLLSNQEETDTRVVLYLQYAASIGFPEAIVRTPASDIFFILLHNALNISMTIYMDVGVGKNRRLKNVTEIAESKGAEYCTAVLGLCVFTGEDATCAFKGMGKVASLKKLERNPKFQSVFRYSRQMMLVYLSLVNITLNARFIKF